jgi:DNA-binding CsgD family transcriptional regulator
MPVTHQGWLPRHEIDSVVDASWAQIDGAGGGLLLLRGPVGVGKTTTARRLVKRWIIGATAPSLEPPLGLWTRLASVLRHDGVATPEVFHRFALHELTDAVRHQAVTELLTQLATHPQPEVLFDDLHSADPASLTALAQVASALPTMGVRIVATTRGADAHPVPMARRAHRILDRHALVVDLEPLTPDELLVWLQILAPHDATVELAEAIHRATGGTPLAVAQFMTWARRDHRPLNHVAADLDRSPLRPSQQLWAPVIGDVYPRAQLVLAVIAELGDRARVELLADSVSSTHEVIAQDLATLIAHGLVQVTDRDRFCVAHPSVAEAVAIRGPWLTHEHHRRIADGLADSHNPGNAELRRRHLSAAGVLVSPGELLSAALESANTAMALGDAVTAANAWAQVTSLDDHPSNLIECARAHRRAGMRQQARRFALQATSTSQHSALLFAEAALLAADGSEFHGDAWATVSLLERALEALKREHEPVAQRLCVELLGTLATLEMTLPLDGPTPRLADLVRRSTSDGAPVMWQWLTQPERAQPRATQAEALAAELGDDLLQATAGLSWRAAHQGPIHREGRLQRSSKARALFHEPRPRAEAVRACLLDALEGGDRSTVNAAMADLTGIDHQAADASLTWRLMHTRAMLARADGDVAAAERLSEEAFLLGRLADEPTAVVVRAEQWAVHATDHMMHVDQVLAAGTDYRALRHPPVLAGALALCAELAAAGISRAGVDTDMVRQLVDHLHTPSSHEQNWMVTAAFTARAVWLMSLTDVAEPLLRLLEPWNRLVARESSGIVCDGHVMRHVATLGHLLGADTASVLTEAIARDRAAGFERSARCGEIDLLTMQAIEETANGSDIRSAAEHLMDQCSGSGLACLAAQAGRLGRRLPSEPISRRQQRILLLLAQGATYQQIADSIGFSHGTVRAEVTRLYAVLGSDRRDEALVEARWRGLLDSAAIG